MMDHLMPSPGDSWTAEWNKNMNVNMDKVWASLWNRIWPCGTSTWQSTHIYIWILLSTADYTFRASMSYLCCWLESHLSLPRRESVLAALWRHTAAEHYCPEKTWSWSPKSWLSVLHSCQVQLAERAHPPGSQVRCRSGIGPSKPLVCRPFWKAQSAWRFYSHRTRDCLGRLKTKRWDTLRSLIDW